MKTYSAKSGDITREWYLYDADGQVLGRLASDIARRLKGKNSPLYTPHVDTGDFVVVINAEKITLTGRKRAEKVYYRHSGYPGGLKSATARDVLEKKPENLLRMAVRGMLPKNTLGRKMLKKLKIYAGSEHPHGAQLPKIPEYKS
ncbi:MAG: 50S ribosomal protein L13 [Syntrophales bacterium]|jgi:large subunit ribosomal protein L13|nr:50S ribosomal protein L13 [Syntrophales bacterium]MCK9527894.1 50S ribosomal protein L13 [Syntrophales bacterium]